VTDLLVRHRRLPWPVPAEPAFRRLFGAERHAFWLDSSRAEPGAARFSYLGAATGVLSYRLGEALDVFDTLRGRLARRVHGGEQFPFGFRGGYVGFFGYELKALCGAPSRFRSPTPDAVWLRATRFVVLDHEAHETWIVALCPPTGTAAADQWLDSTVDMLGRAAGGTRVAAFPPVDPARLGRGPEGYRRDIRACLEALRAGESYEICLTNELVVPVEADPLDLYAGQRLANPAPYAAFLRLDGFAVLSSSPERFLRIEPDGLIESKPIKGTVGRERDPAELTASAKTRAENLMIVDLVRNDLGRICRVGTVTVPAFLAVETYATVHQLVSTVRGRLRADVDALDAVRACFPGGSMTGAPKLRTMEIIERLEGRARGVYSGALGWLGFDGAADLSIVIRTAVVQDGLMRVGAGGAIVLDSDPGDEYEEMMLKLRATCAARLQPRR
jgi:para-aminobenzoate synthetase